MSDADKMARAGDYVLGLMNEAERERAELDMLTDDAFRDCVALLAVRMSALDDTAEDETAVSPRVWADIERRIASLPQMQDTTVPDLQRREDERGRQIAAIAAARKTADDRRAAYQLGGWRGLALAASLLVACGIGYIGGSLSERSPEPVVMVVLVNEDNIPGAVVEAFGDDRVRIVPLVDFEVPEGKVLQAWTLWDQAVGPVSLGTFESAREIVLDGPASQPAPRQDQLYEITLEDAPGSYAGRPLGPILVKGLAVKPPV